LIGDKEITHAGNTKEITAMCNQINRLNEEIRRYEVNKAYLETNEAAGSGEIQYSSNSEMPRTGVMSQYIQDSSKKKKRSKGNRNSNSFVNSNLNRQSRRNTHPPYLYGDCDREDRSMRQSSDQLLSQIVNKFCAGMLQLEELRSNIRGWQSRSGGPLENREYLGEDPVAAVDLRQIGTDNLKDKVSGYHNDYWNSRMNIDRSNARVPYGCKDKKPANCHDKLCEYVDLNKDYSDRHTFDTNKNINTRLIRVNY
jgi:hypothetical protein